jgi:hypothetical protein
MKYSILGLSRRLSVLMAFLLTGLQSADALVIDATADTWIREANPATAYPDDLVSVWFGGGTARRSGVVVFDLSPTIGVTITQAYLEFFDRDDTRSRTKALVQQASLLGTTPQSFISDPTNLNAYTWDEFMTFDNASKQSLESLGAYDIAVGDLQDGYEPSELASATDLSLLASTRDNNSNVVVFILEATAGERDWGDIEFGSTPPRLVINEPLPVLGDFTGDYLVTEADFQVLTAPENWFEEVPAGTKFDLNNDRFVDLQDFKAFKTIFQLHNPGAVLSLPSATVVPEPSTLWAGSLLLLWCGTAWRKRLLGFVV